MRYCQKIAQITFCFIASVSGFAAQITGTVTNGTTNKPSSGDAVVLLSLASGMEEVAKTKTDSQGHFTLNVPDEGAPHLVRVERQSVHYFKSAPPGATTADVTVYDAATQLNNVVTDARVFRLQASGGSMDVSDLYVLNNESQPPRSRIGNQTFAVTLPDGAEMGEASLTGPSGMPLTVTPVPSGVKNRYAFDFPIRPGKTKFEMFYKLPYSGQYEFSITPETPLNELGVLLPKSMKFTGVSAGFAQDSDEAGLAVFFAKNVVANQLVKFSVSGEGLAGNPADAQSGAGNATAAPGSGSGSQSNAAWYIGGVIVLLVAGGFIVLWRRTGAGKTGRDPKSAKPAARPRVPVQSQPDKPALGDMLDVLKDELFQLETDRLNGKISQEEYEKTKAGLDTLFRRQIKKK
ncbi:MAG: hypothetical protein LAO78_18775 [Acidobacteriia bacterium]|nr:hypothetical protein [Terriglobia bacterium]